MTDRMTNEELDYYNQFSEEFTIYRGTNEEEFESKEFGVSWTPEQKVAEFFAFREEELTSERSKRIVLAATVHKADICLLYTSFPSVSKQMSALPKAGCLAVGRNCAFPT